MSNEVKEALEEIYAHLEGIKDNMDRMTSGNFMHNKAATKFATNVIKERLEFIETKINKKEPCIHYDEGYGCEISPQKKCDSCNNYFPRKKTHKFNIGDTIRKKSDHSNCITISQIDEYFYYANSYNIIIDIADKEWELVDESPSNDLENEIHKYIDIPDNQGNPELREELSRCAYHFAEWQKQQDDRHIDDLQWKAHGEGWKECKQQMLEDAVEVEVGINWEDGTVNVNIPIYRKEGDKIKLVIINED